MARYPGADWRPISAKYLSGKRISTYNRVNLHVTAGTGSPFGFFNQPNRASSHLFVYKSGRVEQYVDTAYRAEADGDGNDATISVETEGAWPASVADTEPWTPEQVEALAQIYAWAVKTHGIARKVATSSRYGAESKGLSWHRLGIDGNWPSTGNARGRLQRGASGVHDDRFMHYSSSWGKACPGLKKIGQVPTIFKRAEAILDGRDKPAASRDEDRKPVKAPAKPKPAAKPKPKRPNVRPLQRAVHADPDNIWGPDTDRLALAVREASRYGGQDFPYGVKTAQRAVGTTQDGKWGDKSRAAHDATVVKIQKWLGVTPDGIWGAKTDKAFLAKRKAAKAAA
jgi:hypothetical protein